MSERKKVYMYEYFNKKVGRFIRPFDSVTEAAEYLKCERVNIRDVLNKRKGIMQKHGYHFTFTPPTIELKKKQEEELVKAIANLKGEDKADLERELKDYQKYVKTREAEAKKLARAEEASAKKILAQKKRDEAETARLIEKGIKDEERAFKQREAQRKRLRRSLLTISTLACRPS